MKARNITIVSIIILILLTALAVQTALAADVLNVKKTATGSYNTTWTWTIEKTGDQTELTLSPGQTFDVNYEVTVTPVSQTSWSVSGTIQMRNITATDVVIDHIGDVLSDGTVATVTCPYDFPYTLPSDWTTPACSYTASGTGTPPVSNTATVYIIVDDSVIVGGSDVEAVNYTGSNEIDECVDVEDDQFGFLGTVCAGDADKTFNYTQTVGPFEVCGPYEFVNIASFITNDSGATGSSSWTVDVTVPCAGGCSLTPGYWKTHSSFGPAPYDDTWALLGENTPFFFSGVSYYDALWVSPNGNAYWILAHAYIAAMLNQLNGADFTAAQAAFNSATALFSNPTYTPTYIGGLRGSNSIRQSFIAYAAILDNYNNGVIGPGHCSE